MPIVAVSLIAGRDGATKSRLIFELTEATARALDIEPERVRVLLHELPPAHWGVGGVSKAEDVS